MLTPRLTDTGSRFSNTNISASSKPKSEQLEMKCKGPRPKQFMQKPRKIGSLPCPFNDIFPNCKDPTPPQSVSLFHNYCSCSSNQIICPKYMGSICPAAFQPFRFLSQYLTVHPTKAFVPTTTLSTPPWSCSTDLYIFVITIVAVHPAKSFVLQLFNQLVSNQWEPLIPVVAKAFDQ